MILCRLNPHNCIDQQALYTAFEWREAGPRWWSNAQQVFGADTWEEFLERAKWPEQINIAVFNDEAIYSGFIMVRLVAPKIYEFFFYAPRKSDAELLTLACFQVGTQLLIDDQIAEKVVSWVCSRHRGAIKLNLACGMLPDGLSMYRGGTHGKPLEWIRLTMTRERLQELLNEQGQEDKTRGIAAGNILDHERFRLYDGAGYARHPGGAQLATAS